MKIFKLSYGLIAAAGLMLASCVKNELPSFSDGDAFVAIQTSTASVAENAGKAIEIPVMLTSLSGISGSVDFVIETDSVKGAVEGVNYKLGNESKTLTFTKDAPSQSIIIEPIDNDTFTGDVKFTIKLTNAQGATLGASKTCVVTIEDDEHPLSFILGTMTAVGPSYFNGEEEWTVVFGKDDTDLNKVWITNLVKGGSSASSPVYGVVNEERTEIHIPVGQEIAVSSSYPHILLEGFYGAEGEEDIPTGGYITGLIDENGTITIQDWFGSHVYTDDAGTSAGWYNIFQAGVVLKK